MRVLLQVVSKARVSVGGQEVGAIGRGYLLFSGFEEGDDPALLARMADKISHLRVFPDENGKTNLSLSSVGGAVLSVSQFTLYADLREGNRPSFTRALPGERSQPLFALWNNLLRERFPAVESGVFGADMQVELVNEGPFTLHLDSDDLFRKKAL